MSSITNIDSTDLITDSRADINNNFANLNADKMETSVLDTDTTLAADSDSKVATQKAVKAYVDAGGNVNATETTKGIVEIATQAEVDAGTATGATGASLVVTPETLQGSNISSFGGDGTDGALDTSGGTVDLDLGAANVVQKNYTSITVASNNLTFSNKASSGTIVFLRSQGDVTISSGAKIDATGIGANAATTGYVFYNEVIPAGVSVSSSQSGASAGTTVSAADKKTLIYDPSSDTWKLLRRSLNLFCGSGGGTGSTGDGSGGVARGGGGGSGASYFNGAGGAGGDGGAETGGAKENGDAGVATGNIGSGGGGGGGGASDGNTVYNNGSGGAGGAGGGCVVIECGGSLIFAGEVDVSGNPGSAGTDVVETTTTASGGGGGGGGSAGMCLILANTITTNSGTINAKGGAGGDGGDATSSSNSGLATGGAGGSASASSQSGLVTKNLYF